MTRRPVRRRGAALAALAAGGIAGLTLATGTATAAPCAAGLTVRGVPVTGADCEAATRSTVALCGVVITVVWPSLRLCTVLSSSSGICSAARVALMSAEAVA